MRFLSVVWYKVLPAKYGGQKGIANFQQHLAKKAALRCLCAASNEPTGGELYEIQAELPVSKLQFIHPLVWWKIVKAAKVFRASHLVLEHPYHGLAGFLVKKICGAKLILHSHNIEHLRFKEQGAWWWRMLYFLERWTHRQADFQLFKTEEDLQTAVRKFRLHPDRCMVLPYCVDKPVPSLSKWEAKQKICAAHNLAPDTKIFLFAGTLDYRPNADAVTAIVQQILPLYSLTSPFKVLVCGRNHFPSFQYLKQLRHEHFVYVGEVENIKPYFLAADAFINPVIEAAGIQTKVVDALAWQCNVVSFQKGLDGIPDSICGDKLFPVADGNWEEFAAQMENALQHTELLPPAFFEYFSWDRVIDHFLQRLKTI
jgi:polysaccharide biosynthesis protein PslH